MGLRKFKQIMYSFYKILFMPLYRSYLECKTKSVLKQGVFLYGHNHLEGKNFIGQNTYLADVEMGYASYISQNGYLINTTIGKYTSMGHDIKIVAGKHPIHQFVSTHPAFYSPDTPMGLSYVNEEKYQQHNYLENGKFVHIGNDVWIGDNVRIMEGVTIGDGAIIGCCSLVNKDIEAYSINVGIPARKIDMRFSKEEIGRLTQLQWWNKDNDWIKDHAELFANMDSLFKGENWANGRHEK